jgi:hypothetical protein
VTTAAPARRALRVVNRMMENSSRRGWVKRDRDADFGRCGGVMRCVTGGAGDSVVRVEI